MSIDEAIQVLSIDDAIKSIAEEIQELMRHYIGTEVC